MKRIGKKLWVLLLISTLIIVSTASAVPSNTGETQGQIDANNLVDSQVNPNIPASPLGTLTSFDAYLKIDGIPGESTNDRHKDWIDIKSYEWGETHGVIHSMGGGGGAGKVNMQDFRFVMKFNKASPKLFLAVANGKHIKNAVLEVCRKGKDQVCFMNWTLSDVVATSYQTVGGSQEGDVEDQFGLNFGKIEIGYKPQNPDGSLGEAIKAFWDLITNKGG
jgi:type VI secretion system secreted protein Hcp